MLMTSVLLKEIKQLSRDHRLKFASWKLAALREPQGIIRDPYVWLKQSQTELTKAICSKGLITAIGKVLLIKIG